MYLSLINRAPREQIASSEPHPKATVHAWARKAPDPPIMARLAVDDTVQQRRQRRSRPGERPRLSGVNLELLVRRLAYSYVCEAHTSFLEDTEVASRALDSRESRCRLICC